MENLRKNRTIGIIEVLCAVFAAMCVALSFSACAKSYGVSFYTDEINMYVGETRDLAPYIAVMPPPSACEFSFETSGECVSVAGSVVTAISEGSAVVTAKCEYGTATIKINSAYRAPIGIYITTNGRIVQNIAEGEEPQSVRFSAVLDDFADRDAEIVWTVNGKKCGSGGEYELAPTSYGEYAVTASAKGLSHTETVKIYRPTDIRAYFDGETLQNGDYSAVRFYAAESADPRNPRSVYEWTVNGETASVSQVFDFTPPEAGEYEIALTANGAPRMFGSGATVTVKAGVRAPEVTEAVFDDVDGVFVTWSDGKQARSVEITSPDGARRVFELADAQYSERFGGGKFDATGFIEPCAEEPGVYKIRITADGRGDEYEFRQYPHVAQEYIDDTVLCRNSFISSAADAEAWVFELYALGRTRATCYLGRGADGAETAVAEAAKVLGATVDVSIEGRFLTADFDGFVNAPQYGETAVSAAQLYALLPHIEYDAAKRRSASYVLALDRVKRSAAVETSEQLLLTALCGVRPAPKANSAAAVVYERARRVLISIIGADYTPAQKVHAIYDWLQYACAHARGAGAGSSARFLDGLFGGGMEPTGVLDSLGMSKAFALMSRMEGVECTIECDGDEFYNKVVLNDIPYIVDVYGGETAGLIAPTESSAPVYAELRSHAGLLISAGGPLFDDGELYYLQKGVFDGSYYDHYIDRAELDDTAAYGTAVNAAFVDRTRSAVTIAGVNGITIFEKSTVGAEFLLDCAMTEAETEKAIAALSRAVCDAYIEYINKDAADAELSTRIRLYRDGNILHMIVTIPIDTGKAEGV